jgi:hypothetical protein
MKTIEKAHQIFASAPQDAAKDALGLAAVAFFLFAGFLVPAFV